MARVSLRSLVAGLVLGIGAVPAVLAAPAAIHQRGGAPTPVPAHHHTAKKHPVKHGPSLVTMKVVAGYDDEYRTTAWVPIRVTLHNRTTNTISGTLEVPDTSTGQSNFGPPQPYGVLYQMPIVLPGAATKRVTLYVPGSSISNFEVTVKFLAGGHVVASGYDTPSSFDTTTISVGALAADPAGVVWVRKLSDANSAFTMVRLQPATIDPTAAALANFDLIVIDDGSVAQLDSDQLSALRQYVHAGGTVVLVGGPGWQEALRPLPADLIPGTLSGSRTVPDLRGLAPLAGNTSPRRRAPTTIGVLRDPRGTVLASEDGVPLAVRDFIGSGEVLYLAFDPNLAPLAQWSNEPDILSPLLIGSTPQAAGRISSPQTAPPQSLFFNPFGGPSNIGAELDNVPAAALPSIVLFIVLTVLYILLLGPVNFLVLRRLRRSDLLWVTVPVGSLVCLGATFGVAFHLKGSTVLVNTAGVIELSGRGGPTPAALYLGLFAPVRGDYHLTYDGAALPQYVPQFYYGGPIPQGQSRPLGLRLQEGAQTQIDFVGMNMWSMRNAALHTTVNVPGRILSKLHIDRHGNIVGAVHNDTRLTLIHPTILAGQAVIKLANMPPEKTIPIRIRPHVNLFKNAYAPIWNTIYGPQQFGPPVYYNQGGGIPFFSGIVTNGPPGPGCCYGPPQATEQTFVDRLRNTATQLPEAQSITSLGEVLFIAWNQQPIGTLTVDGSIPQRRDLNLIVSPLSVNLVRGPFTLRKGTFGAHLIDINPQSSARGCCCCGPTSSQLIDVGYGGSATFEFDLPQGSHLHFHNLWLDVNAGGADGWNMGHAWDWQAHRWVPENLTFGYARLQQPGRFISPQGQVRIKLVNGDATRDIRITDAHRDIQLSGDGVVT